MQNSTSDTVSDKLMQFYASFSLSSMTQIESLYAKNIHFKDPIHEVNTLDDLKTYFSDMMTKTTKCRFEFLDYEANKFYCWKMHFEHPKVNSGNEVVVEGISHIKVDDQSQLITFQQDFYDMGAMLYEHLPVLGWTINKIKSRMK